MMGIAPAFTVEEEGFRSPGDGVFLLQFGQVSPNQGRDAPALSVHPAFNLTVFFSQDIDRYRRKPLLPILLVNLVEKRKLRFTGRSAGEEETHKGRFILVIG